MKYFGKLSSREMEIAAEVFKATLNTVAITSQATKTTASQVRDVLLSDDDWRDRLRSKLEAKGDRPLSAKHTYYWSDPGGFGWDIVASAESLPGARSIAKENIALETLPEECTVIQEQIELQPPTGIFVYDCAVCIFTECDPEESRIARKNLDKLKQDRKDLLEALKRIRDQDVNCSQQQDRDDWEFANAAIAKAEGE